MRFVLILCLSSMLLGGCSGHKQTFVSKEGTTTVEGSGNNQTVTVTSKEGSAKYGKGAVDPAKLGLPVYPDSTASEGAMTGTNARGSGEIVTLATAESFDKVYAWYQAHMPAGSEKMHMNSGGSAVATFAIGKGTDKEQRSVVISAGGDKTSIMLSHSVRR